jgi:predicted MPP superfamily phosphohydrolase
MLSNQARAARTRFGDLWIVGLDDLLLGRPDLDAAFREVPADAPCVCLWHEGDLADKAAPYGSILQLSGHSHGGQVRFPVIGPVATPRLGRRYVRGRFQIDDMELYVSSGLGMYRPPVRLNCPPELTIVQFVE